MMESIIVINRVCAASRVVAVWLAVQQDIKHWRRQSPLEDMYQHSRCSYDFCMHFYNAVNCDDDFQREREWVEGGGVRTVLSESLQLRVNHHTVPWLQVQLRLPMSTF